jgi:hypothetical protein
MNESILSFEQYAERAYHIEGLMRSGEGLSSPLSGPMSDNKSKNAEAFRRRAQSFSCFILKE